MTPELIKTLAMTVFAALVIVAAVKDLATFTIPNWISLALCAGFVGTALAGGALALGLLALRSAWLSPLAAAGPAWTKRLSTPGEAAPYGVAIALGALAAFAAHPLS